MTLASLKMLTLDSSDARRDATFWSAVLGWDIAHEQDEYAMLTGPGGMALGFGTVEDHQPPAWPNEHGSKQFHLDLAVDDLDAVAVRCTELGATLADPQPGETWRVLLDPSGHPFCLTQAGSW
ncbi:VOC family protein [Aquihabitans daechungensis]|uniref:VOC family protein n=1 Tax=Aquihabitans daechungensis TaxID=1052257 RepID=UPI003BA35C50